MNLSTDLVNDAALRTTAALRYADHHLNAMDASVFLPKDSSSHVDFFCVSQACITYSADNLKEHLQNARIHSGTVIPVESEMWTEALGTTSITFGHAISFDSELLATMTRIYARINTQTGALLKVSDKERTDLFPARTPRRDVVLPTVTKLAIPPENGMMQPLFDVRIGPQHCNNNHVDHAALADLLLQGMYIQGSPCEKGKLVVRYLAPAELDRTLSVCVHRSQPLAALYKKGVDTPLVIGQVEVPISGNL